jgi:uncharacterized protein
VSAMPDELTRPPGLAAAKQTTGRSWSGRRFMLIGGTASLVGLSYLAGSVWLSGREPYAVAPIRPGEAVTAAEPMPHIPPKAPPAAVAADGSPPGRPIQVPAVRKLAAAPDPRLVERTEYGPLPRIGQDGARPASVYRRPTGPVAKAGARIAILVAGLGISQSDTADSIEKLPAAVTLAFGPYGDNLERTVGEARDKGHEVMLQVPMEPFDYPDNDPGPHTLTVQAGQRENADRLHWIMGRFTGYFGLVNAMGAKLTANEAALQPLVSEIASRGLVFLDDGSSPRSVIAATPSPSIPTARANIVLDAVPRPDAVEEALTRLEALARERGLAVGTANAAPATLDRIARWAKTLPGKGIELVPVSSAYEGLDRR